MWLIVIRIGYGPIKEWLSEVKQLLFGHTLELRCWYTVRNVSWEEYGSEVTY